MSARPRLLQVSTIALAAALLVGAPFAGAAAWAEPLATDPASVGAPVDDGAGAPIDTAAESTPDSTDAAANEPAVGAAGDDAPSVQPDESEARELAAEPPAGSAAEVSQAAVVPEELTDAASEPAPAPSAADTTITISASTTSVVEGSALELTATVDPSSAVGAVQFRVDDQPHGAPVAVERGSARLSARLAVGTHTVDAAFTPADAEAFTEAKSESLQVTVARRVVDVDVTSAQLTWGVKKSFRDYIDNWQFGGLTSILGSTKQSKKQGEFVWSGGTGSVKSDASAASTAFGAGNGVHFQSHPMSGTYALDLQFTNPQIEVLPDGTGKLYLDVKSRKFDGLTAVSPQFFIGKKVHVANLDFPAATVSGKTTTWANATATLTRLGAVEAFGGFYEAGTALDPITLSVETDTAVTGTTPTSVSLSASSAKVDEGTAVTLTASTSPRGVAGDVRFSAGGSQLASSATTGGSATASVRLPVGIHSVTATFTPKSDEYGRSVSSPIKVTVLGAKAPKPEAPAAPVATGAAAAGSLSWSISDAFRAYTTCDGKEAYGFSHCAKGSVETSGVGAGYLFPQAASSSWNRDTQTGTVAFSGSVAFRGYGMTIFNVANPSITVTGPTSATLSTGNATSFGAGSYQLDLASGSKSVGANGEVTWSNVPVIGSLSSGGAGGSGAQSIGLDPLTFTVGSASQVSYGATTVAAEKRAYTAAETAPATTGITVLTDAKKIKPGGRIEIEASGFDPDDEGVLVVLYPGKIVLDDEATADENGTVRWAGTLPRDVKGEHVITLQGSTDAGAVIDIVAAKAQKRAAQTAEASGELLETRAVQDQAAAAGVAPAAAGMALWEWWASAGGLVVIAACMTALAVRQRRSAP